MRRCDKETEVETEEKDDGTGKTNGEDQVGRLRSHMDSLQLMKQSWLRLCEDLSDERNVV